MGEGVALRRVLLLAILAIYVLLGTLYAVNTPDWQAPDEPAHYNYIRTLVTTGRFPVLQPGDYPADYLDEIKRLGFPAEMSIDPIRYEFHQPPLYYILAAPFYILGNGALLPIRLFSVFLGVGIVWAAYAVARLIVPREPAIALGTAALIAFLPQHLATVSQVGNDVLAELLVGLVLLILLIWLRPPVGQMRASGGWPLFGLGLLLGLILITKTTAYIAVPLVFGVMLWRWLAERASLRRVASDTVAVWVPAILIALPWYARNLAIYGWPDALGLLRHDAVVVGQLRTEEFLAQNGAGVYVERLGEFTFKSFWGVFGWLGIFMDSRVYFVLTLLTVLAVAGLFFRWLVWPRRQRAGAAKRAAYAPVLRVPWKGAQIVAAPMLFTVMAYGWYNIQFVQHQGRYLFTALIPIAIGFCLGWDEAVTPRSARFLAAGLVLLGLVMAGATLWLGQGLPKWPLALTGAAAVALALASILPARFRYLSYAAPFLLLPIIAIYAVWGPITP